LLNFIYDMNERNAKILTKIADNRSEPDFLKMLFDAGADVAWINTAHQGEEETIQVIKKIRSVSDTIPIMIDTKGPEIRIKDIEKPIEVKKGDHVVLTGDLTQVGQNVIHVSYANFHKEIPVGESVLYDDALIEMIVVEKMPKGIKCVVKSDGLLKNKKSLNVPNVHIDLPALSEKDKGFIHFCAKNNVDFIAHSFVRSKKDIFEILKITAQYPNYVPKIIAKIENREGFNNVREILKYCEGIMVARGDLGAEVPIEELPYMQKKMVLASLEAGKYSIVATQVLESMIKNPRPTRAEVSDIGNAILDGSGAMSMSGETAYGDHPEAAVIMMGRVMKYTENKRDELIRFSAEPKNPGKVFKMAKSLLKKAEKANVKAILCAGCDMSLVRALSAYRPHVSVVAGFASIEDVRETGLAYAIKGVLLEQGDAGNPKSLVDKVKASFKPKDTVLVIQKKSKGYSASVRAFGSIK
jgi:pyruvate kinase